MSFAAAHFGMFAACNAWANERQTSVAPPELDLIFFLREAQPR